MLTYEQARHEVVEQVKKKKHPRATVDVSVWEALGFVLAQEIRADRDYPPFDRSTRDGYAVRAAEAIAGAKLRCIGEIKAGDTVSMRLASGTCIQIMTGAAVPEGADSVVMIEHTRRAGEGREVAEENTVQFEKATRIGQNVVLRGTEALAGEVVLSPASRLGYAELAIAAQVGCTKLQCAAKPRVAILSTGDEVIPIEQTPGPVQIRNSNSVSLAAQVRLAGGEPVLLGNAADRLDDLREKISRGLQQDVLVLSGGVSVGKYDLVETVLKDLGAQIYFESVAIRPGKPAVFGRCGETFVFGLPGNPVSTMVTFELFVKPALDLLRGAEARNLPLLEARLAETLFENPGLTHFLPARVDWRATPPQVATLHWHGSGDVTALALANCFLVVPPDCVQLNAGDSVNVLLRKDVV